MLNFLKALIIFIRMYRDGFYPSATIHRGTDGSRWGFYRINHVRAPAMFDINYSLDETGRNGYAHGCGDDFRFTFDAKNKCTNVVKTTMKMVDNNNI